MINKLKINPEQVVEASLKFGDVLIFRSNLCFVSDINKSHTLLNFYSEEKGAIYFYKIRTTNDKHKVLIGCENLMPPQLKENYSRFMTKIKKGDYVSFMKDNKKCYGSVLKGGKRVVVIMKDLSEIGGEYQNFTVIDPPTIEIPESLKDWSCVSYKENQALSQETVCFSVDVKHKNKKVFQASNSGHGGCMETRYIYTKKEQESLMNGNHIKRNEIPEFIDAVTESVFKLFPDENNRPLMSEIEETYILWYNTERKMHVSWKDLLKFNMMHCPQ